MNDKELLTIIKYQVENSVRNGNFNRLNIDLFNSYNQEKYGNEEKGRSQVVSADHYDMVESDMTALVETFLGGGDILKFEPLGKNDIEEAEQKTRYANHIIRNQKESFRTLHGWMKEPGFSKISVVKYFMEDIEVSKYVRYENISDDEYASILDSLKKGKNVIRVDELEQESEDEETNVKFKVIYKQQKISIINVPVENFIISKGAECKEDAEVIGDETIMMKSDLIAQGFDEEIIKKLAPMQSEHNKTLKHKRLQDQDGGYDLKTGVQWQSEEVEIQHLFSMIDMDNDGALERRSIIRAGDVILQNEPFDHAPYAILSQILMPHTVIGKSRGETTAEYQKEKTSIKRGIMDNIYEVNRPRVAVDDSDGSMDGGSVDLDDYLGHKIGGVVRVDGTPHDKIMPLLTPYIGDSALQVVQYIDSEKAQSVGQLLATQGLSADDFGEETATRFEGVDKAGKAKIKLVSRVYAETGFRELFEGVIWLAQHFQNEKREIQVLGKPLIVDPQNWQHEHYALAEVGLALGESEEAIANLGILLETQLRFINQQSTISDYSKVYNTLTDITKLMGKNDTAMYFNDPTKPDEVLQAENEQLTQVAQLMKQHIESLGNPLAEAEEVKAQADLMKARATQDLNIAKLEEEHRQFNAELTAKVQAQFDELQAKYTEMELKYSQDIKGQGIE